MTSLKKIESSALPSFPAVRLINSEQRISVLSQKENNRISDCLKKIWKTIIDFFCCLFCCKKKEPVQRIGTSSTTQASSSRSKTIPAATTVNRGTLTSKEVTVKDLSDRKATIKQPEKKDPPVASITTTKDKENRQTSKPVKTDQPSIGSMPSSIVSVDEKKAVGNAKTEPDATKKTEQSDFLRIKTFYEHVLDESFPLEDLKKEAEELLKPNTATLRTMQEDLAIVMPAAKHWSESHFTYLFLNDVRTSKIKECANRKLHKAEDQKTSEAAQRELPKAKEEIPSLINKDVEILSSIITQLDTNPVEGENLHSLLQHLQTLVPGIDVPVDPYDVGTPEEGQEALKAKVIAKQKQLSEALKAHRAFKASVGATTNPEKEREIVVLKSQMHRLSDLLEASRNPCKRPEYPLFIRLNEQLNQDKWRKPHEPLTKIPGYIFEYPHPADSGECEGGSLFEMLLMGPQRTSWDPTLEYIEEHVLKTPLESLSAEQLEKLFYELYVKLSEVDAHPNDSLLRKVEMTVLKDEFRNAQITPANIARILEQSDPAAAKAYLEVVQMSKRWGGSEKVNRVYCQRHWKVFEKISAIPTPAVEQVPPAMKKFFTDLEQVLKNPKLHPYQKAAFIQYSIATIHPFGDINGRMARILMNILFMQKGMLPIFIINDKAYSALFKVPADSFEEAFCEFLRKTHAAIEILLAQGKISMEKSEEDGSGDCRVM